MVKRNDSPVICLEEVRRSQREAAWRLGEAIGRTCAQVLEAFTRVSDVARATGIALTGLRRAQESAGVHAFTPDLDLRCSVRGCGVGPEEHNPW